MQIDAHHHFWQPARGDYGWIPEDNDILNRAYGPADIAPILPPPALTPLFWFRQRPAFMKQNICLD